MIPRPSGRPARTKPFPAEKNFQTAAMKRIRDPRDEDGWGGSAYHPIGTGATSQGEPDIIAVIPIPYGSGGVVYSLGRHVVIELKQPGNEPTPKQASRLRKYADSGSHAGWATTMEEVDAILEHADDPSWRHADYPHFRPKAHARSLRA